MPDEAASPPPQGELVHLCPGRARLRFADRRGDAAFFDALAAACMDLPGMRHAEGRALTGSLILEFEGPPEALLPAIGERGLFALALPAPGHPLAEDLLAGGLRLDGLARLASNNAVDLRSAGILALTALGLVQLARGRAEISAITAFWYAASLLMGARAGGPSGEGPAPSG